VSFDANLIKDTSTPFSFKFNYVAGTLNNRAVVASGTSDVDANNQRSLSWKTSQVNQNTASSWCAVFNTTFFENDCNGQLSPAGYPQVNIFGNGGILTFNQKDGNYNDMPVSQVVFFGIGQARLGNRYPSLTQLNLSGIQIGAPLRGGDWQFSFSRSFDNQPGSSRCDFGGAGGFTPSATCSLFAGNGNRSGDGYSAEFSLSIIQSPTEPVFIRNPLNSPLFTVSASAQNKLPALSLQIDGNAANPNTNSSGTISNLDADFGQLNSAPVSLSIPQSEFFILPKVGGGQQLYWLSRVTDRDAQGDQNSLYTRGGIAMCVMDVMQGGKYNLQACQTPRTPTSGSLNPEGFAFGTANKISGNTSYLSTPIGMSYTVSPAPDNQVFVNYFGANGSIYTLNATDPNSAWNNWVRINNGQSAACTNTLKLPPEPKSYPIWVQILLGLAEIAVMAVLPEAIPLILDITMAVAEPLIGAEESVSIYNGVALLRDCKVGGA
jgi:hypothetical protein